MDHLDKENYRSWKMRMKIILEEQNLWQYIVSEPKTTIDWRIGDQRALETIMLHTKASYLKYIINGESAKAIWMKLENIFDPPIQRVTRSHTMLTMHNGPSTPQKNQFMKELEVILDQRGSPKTLPKPPTSMIKPLTVRIPPKVPQKPTMKPKVPATPTNPIVTTTITKSLSRVELVRKLLALRFTDEQNLRDYFNTFLNHAESLKQYKDLVSDNMVSMVFLASLPKSYATFVNSLESNEKIPSIYAIEFMLLKKQKQVVTPTEPLQQVNIYVSSSEWSLSLGGANYFVLLTDVFTRKMFVYFMKSREEFMNKFLIFKSQTEKQSKRKIKSICGKKIENDKFKRYLEEHNINVIVSYEGEDDNVKIKEIAKRMMSNSSLNQKLWAEAVNTAVYLKNRIPLPDRGRKTPYELWNGVIPKIAHIRKFGSTVLLLKSQFKVAFKLVGYENDSDEYRCYDPSTKKIIRTSRVTFLTNTPVSEPENLMDNLSRISGESGDLGEYFLYQEYDSSIYDEVDSDGYIQPVKCECTSGVCSVHVFVDYIDFAEC